MRREIDLKIALEQLPSEPSCCPVYLWGHGAGRGVAGGVRGDVAAVRCAAAPEVPMRADGDLLGVAQAPRRTEAGRMAPGTASWHQACTSGLLRPLGVVLAPSVAHERLMSGVGSRIKTVATSEAMR